MSTYNSVNYASDIGLSSTGKGVASTDSTFGVSSQDAKINGGLEKTKQIKWNTTQQPLNIGDIINLCQLPAGARVTSVRVRNDLGTASATLQAGAIQSGTTTAGFFSSAGVSIASANQNLDLITTVANILADLTVTTTVIVTVAGANLTANTNLLFEVKYLTN